MKELYLIQCTKSKRGKKSEAQRLYDESQLFKKMKLYVELKQVPWHILSAKHGMIHPCVEIEPYDEFGLSVNQSESIARRVNKRNPDCVSLLAGKKYVNPLTPELEKYGIEVLEPMRGLRYGERLSWLNDQIKELENRQLTNA